MHTEMDNYKHCFIDVEGIKTHYIEAGTGHPLVLIHGGGALSCAELNYGSCVKHLMRNFRVIAPDVVNFGETFDKSSKIYTAVEQGEFLIKFLKSMNLDSIFIGGNSHGGWLVQYIAHKIPSVVKRLIIINSLNGTKGIPDYPEGAKYIYGPQGHAHPFPTYDSVKDQLSNLYFDQSLVEENRIKMALKIVQSTHKIAKERATTINKSIESTNADLMFNGKHISEFAHKLEMPILMPWGRDDTSMKPDDGYFCEYGWRFFHKLQNAEMYVIPRAKHHVFTDRAERWSELVTSFLKH